MKSTALLVGLLAVTLTLTIVTLSVLFHKELYGTYEWIILDNYSPKVECNLLPDMNAAKYTLATNTKSLKALEAINPQGVFIDVIEACPGKAALEITYNSHQERVEVEKQLSNGYFLGMPVFLRNH